MTVGVVTGAPVGGEHGAQRRAPWPRSAPRRPARTSGPSVEVEADLRLVVRRSTTLTRARSDAGRAASTRRPSRTSSSRIVRARLRQSPDAAMRGSRGFIFGGPRSSAAATAAARRVAPSLAVASPRPARRRRPAASASRSPLTAWLAASSPSARATSSVAEAVGGLAEAVAAGVAGVDAGAQAGRRALPRHAVLAPTSQITCPLSATHEPAALAPARRGGGRCSTRRTRRVVGKSRSTSTAAR